ncbi:DUF4192 domain-containing protein [Microbacterium fluvii]|uniref:DUF4192 domain-containing protein n=1 Tax=Microbacterium fluvii TaxID=415215 RepID=A0ABW2HB85_9MICO|nr:DUF4192 domain-containing protein [Microbacterium fluvii]MCU4672210.1 DUF4192 domain-containing protein [Microbacterium fluvii]
MTSPPPVVLTSATAADFLASLPALAGCTTRESLLIVPFHGRRTLGVMRFDLPQPDDPSVLDHLAAVAIGMLSRMSTCDGAALVVYCGIDFPTAWRRWEPLHRTLGGRLDEAGFAVIDALCVANDGWGSRSAPVVPPGGRPLREIDDSEMTAALAAHGLAGRPGEYDADAQLPPPERSRAARLGEAVARLAEHGEEVDAFGIVSAAGTVDPVALVERLLPRASQSGPLRELAHLVAACTVPATRDQIILQIAFGQDMSRRVARTHAHLHDLQARTGASMDDVVASETAQGRPPFGDDGTLLMGRSDRIPDAERLRQGIALLRHAAAHVEGRHRAGALCVLAWLNWAMGRSTVALRHVEQAMTADPALTMAPLLRRLFDSGTLPDWVYRCRDDAAAPEQMPRRA